MINVSFIFFKREILTLVNSIQVSLGKSKGTDGVTDLPIINGLAFFLLV